jgi:hypothetical protein
MVGMERYGVGGKCFITVSELRGTLEDMLSTTTDVIEQYVKSPSIATKGVLDACLEHNKLFLQKAGIVDVSA